MYCKMKCCEYYGRWWRQRCSKSRQLRENQVWRCPNNPQISVSDREMAALYMRSKVSVRNRMAASAEAASAEADRKEAVAKQEVRHGND